MIPYSKLVQEAREPPSDIVCGRPVKSTVVGNQESLALYASYSESEERARKHSGGGSLKR